MTETTRTFIHERRAVFTDERAAEVERLYGEMPTEAHKADFLSRIPDAAEARGEAVCSSVEVPDGAQA